MTILPLVKQVELSADGPLLYFYLQHLPYSFLLDTGMEVSGLGHHSFIGALPFMVFRAKDGLIKVVRGGRTHCYRGCPLGQLQHLMQEFALPAANTGFPFNGGAVGYFSYDLGRYLEKIPEMTTDDLNTPDCCLGFYDVIAVIDHRKRSVHIVSTGLPAKGEAAVQRACSRLKEFETLFSGAVKNYFRQPSRGLLERYFTRREYMQAVQRVIDYIYAGDIFQANLSQRFSVCYQGDPWELYCKLRRINPAPFAAYLNFQDFKVISASPERFLKVDGRQVETRPIKGTRPRGKTQEQDRQMREELWNSEKDRAELMMIVDLERNDLGRVCNVGSVRVPDLLRLEPYPTVFHLVSTVEGTLPEDKDTVDLLKAVFPGGSITGAPKIRAMEIIEELEPVRRGIYTGSIGYMGFDGRTDLNIVIRTIIARENRLFFQVGGGITADSQPAAEYEETLDKARALMRALGLE